eukprot:6921236-Pyramimonas_sp.AAC.1
MIAQVVKITPRARTPGRSGFIPQATWGLEGTGLAPTTLMRLRAQTAALSGARYEGGCATTAINL